MAVLTRNEILHAVETKDLVFTPQLDAFQIQPHAVDLRLGWTFYIPKSWELNENGRQALNVDYLDIQDKQNYFDIVTLKPGQYFEILPNESIIGTTLEQVEINDLQLMAVLYPRSSFNRRGLSVSLTGIIDAGYQGSLVLPIHNHTTNHVIRIYPGERVCQIVFEELSSKLTPQQAQMHGVKKAKYMGTNTQNVTYQDNKKKEATNEIELIKSGNIEQLKNDFKISYDA